MCGDLEPCAVVLTFVEELLAEAPCQVLIDEEADHAWANRDGGLNVHSELAVIAMCVFVLNHYKLRWWHDLGQMLRINMRSPLNG